MTNHVMHTGLTIRATGDEPEITITTPARDLMRDTIDPLGMDVTSYLRGTRAVNLYHEHNRLPVGKTLSLAKSAQGIRCQFRWLPANPEAATVRAIFEESVLGASVEYVPVESAPNNAGGYHYAKTILTGWALTSNPANPECVRMMKSLGWGADVLALDDEDVLKNLSRADVAAALREARAWVGREVTAQLSSALARARGRVD